MPSSSPFPAEGCGRGPARRRKPVSRKAGSNKQGTADHRPVAGDNLSMRRHSSKLFFAFVFYLDEQFAIFTLSWGKWNLPHILTVMELSLCPFDSPVMFLAGTNLFFVENIIGGAVWDTVPVLGWGTAGNKTPWQLIH